MSQLQPVLTFDGVEDYIEVPYSELHNPKVFTISCWAKFMKIPEGKDIVLLDTIYEKQGVKEGYSLFRDDTKEWRFVTDGFSAIQGSLELALNTWTHLAGTFDGSKAKLYVNGQVVVERIASSQVNTHVSLHIGAGHLPETNVASFFFPGQIAEVCIWNKVRTQQEIQSDMNKRLTGKEAGLVGYWPLNKGSGNIVIDKTGNGKNGIIQGGATWKQEEIPLEPTKLTTGEVQIPLKPSTGVEVTNKPSKDSSDKNTKMASGSTTPGATNWQAYDESSIYVDVDTSAAGFTKTPVYVTSIGGDKHHWKTTGGSAVCQATVKGFRVYIRWDSISATGEALTPAGANGNKWHINWIGFEPSTIHPSCDG